MQDYNMKKINEKQLMESSRALRDYIDSVIEDGSQAAQSSSDTSRDFSWSNAGKALGNIWQGVKNTTNAIGQAGSDIASGFTSVQTPSATQNPSGWPTTPEAIRAFQKANGLKVDGLIGSQTMTALTNKGIKPPAGFKMAGYKTASKPAQAGKPAQVSSPSQESDPELDRLNANIASHQQWFDQQKAARAQAAQQSAQPVPGMQQGLSAASSAITPTFQSQQPVSEDDIEEGEGIPGVVKALGRGLINRTNPTMVKPGVIKGSTAAEKSANRFGRDINKNAPTAALGTAGAAAALSGGPDVAEIPATGSAAPASSETDDVALGAQNLSNMEKRIGDQNLAAMKKLSGLKPQSTPAQKPAQASDPEVANWQRNLKQMGYDVDVDGRMGPQTLKAFQKYMQSDNVQESVSFTTDDTLISRIVSLSKR